MAFKSGMDIKRSSTGAALYVFGGFVRVKEIWAAGMSIQYLRFLLCILSITVLKCSYRSVAWYAWRMGAHLSRSMS